MVFASLGTRNSLVSPLIPISCRQSQLKSTWKELTRETKEKEKEKGSKRNKENEMIKKKKRHEKTADSNINHLKFWSKAMHASAAGL